MYRDPEDEINLAAAAWREICGVLKSEAIRCDVQPLARSALAGYAFTNPGVGFLIGVDGDVELQVDRAVEEWFDASQISLLVQRTLPELLAAASENRIINEVVRDRHGRIRRARTTFRGEVPAGLRESYERRYSKQVRLQMAKESNQPR